MDCLSDDSYEEMEKLSICLNTRRKADGICRHWTIVRMECRACRGRIVMICRELMQGKIARQKVDRLAWFGNRAEENVSGNDEYYGKCNVCNNI